MCCAQQNAENKMHRKCLQNYGLIARVQTPFNAVLIINQLSTLLQMLIEESNNKKTDINSLHF